MTTLRDLNRDEWADEPYLIELRGGADDGKRFRWRTLPMVWQQAVPAPFDSLTWLREPPDVTTASTRVINYRETGSVTDDGAHIYEAEG